MRLNRKQLQNIILKEVYSLMRETDNPDVDRSDEDEGSKDIYREEEIKRVFSENTDADWWDHPADRPGVLNEVGKDALKSLGEFLKKDPAWKAWYSDLADDGAKTGGTL
jgi:hypothetical protein